MLRGFYSQLVTFSSKYASFHGVELCEEWGLAFEDRAALLIPQYGHERTALSTRRGGKAFAKKPINRGRAAASVAPARG
jgi:hypothetical protein